MGFIFFSLPVIGGYHVMLWAITKSRKEIGERGKSPLLPGDKGKNHRERLSLLSPPCTLCTFHDCILIRREATEQANRGEWQQSDCG
jgi:hypothetical protein